MQSTDLEEIKAALWEQAYHQCTRVSFGVAQVISKVWLCLNCLIWAIHLHMMTRSVERYVRSFLPLYENTV